MTRAADLAELGSAYAGVNPLAFRNKLVNGDMRISQRAAAQMAQSLPSGTAKFAADRWMAAVATGTASCSWNNAAAGASNFGSTACAIEIQGAAGVTNPYFAQRIEAINCIDMPNAGYTISFWIYHNTGTTAQINASIACAGVVDNFNTSTDATAITLSQTTVPSNVWVKITGTITMPANSYKGVQVGIGIVGSLVANQVMDISYVQFERGAQPTPFEQRPYGLELSLCQRYFQPGLKANISGYSGIASCTFSQGWTIPAMRITPTIQNVAQGGVSGPVGAITFSMQNAWSIQASCTSTGAAGFITTATCDLSAEL